jgi:hypothetical protein
VILPDPFLPSTTVNDRNGPTTVSPTYVLKLLIFMYNNMLTHSKLQLHQRQLHPTRRYITDDHFTAYYRDDNVTSLSITLLGVTLGSVSSFSLHLRAEALEQYLSMVIHRSEA